MTQVMAKGANAALTARSVRVVLQWRPGPAVPAIDVSGLLITPSGRVRDDTDFVFYNQPQHPSGTVAHEPAGGGTDSLRIDIQAIPAYVGAVVVTASVDEGYLRDVPDLTVRIQDADSGDDILTFTPTGATTHSAYMCGEIYRRGGEWRFRAVGQGYDSGLAGVALVYGVEVDDTDEDEQADVPPQAYSAPTPAPQPAPVPVLAPAPAPAAQPRPRVGLMLPPPFTPGVAQQPQPEPQPQPQSQPQPQPPAQAQAHPQPQQEPFVDALPTANAPRPAVAFQPPSGYDGGIMLPPQLEQLQGPPQGPQFQDQ